MLLGDLSEETFLHWWHQQRGTERDFWVESADILVRVHVTPRRTFFDPRTWRTKDNTLKSHMLEALGEHRSTTCIPCANNINAMQFEHDWRADHEPRADFLWVGRSTFKRQARKQVVVTSPPSSSHEFSSSHLAMEDEQGAVDCRPGGSQRGGEERVDRSRAEVYFAGSTRDTGDHQAQAHGVDPSSAGSTQGQVCRGGSGTPREGQSRAPHEDVEGQCGTIGRGDGAVREVQELQVLGGTGGIPGVGHGGDPGQCEPQPGLGKIGPMGPSTSRSSPWDWIFKWRPGGECGGATTTPEVLTKEDPEGAADTSDRGTSLHGLVGSGQGGDDGGPDQGPGGKVEAHEVGPRAGEEGGGQGSGYSNQGVPGESHSKLKKKAYWARVKKLQDWKKERLQERRASRPEAGGEDVENAVEGETKYNDVFAVNAVDEVVEDFDSSLELESDPEDGPSSEFPRVTLKYPDDYEVVKNLPAKRMKRSSKKRVGGMAKRILSCLMATVSAFASPVLNEIYDTVSGPVRDLYVVTTGHRETETPALLELFAGSAHLSSEFARAGLNVLEPRDLVLGHDLRDPCQQAAVKGDIQRWGPKLLWVALPCTKWSSWQRLNYANRRQELRRQRSRERKLVRFAVECAWMQLEAGREIVFEHPASSDMWRESLITQFQEPEMRMSFVELDMCAYNLRAKTDGGLIKKPTLLMCSHPAMADLLRKTCDQTHPHTPAAGSNTRPAGVYTKEFCRRVVQGYKRSEGTIWEIDEDDPWQAYVNEAVAVDDQDFNRGASGIKVPEHVSPATARALRRVHQNLGHPSNTDLARHLKLSGADQAMVEAAQGIRCETCERLKQPGTRRPAKVVRPLDFNQEVALDVLNLFDLSNNKVVALSMLDMATGYHLVKRISGKKSANYLQDFVDHWVAWAGPPEVLTVDQERGFLKEFVDGMEKFGTRVRFIAGQAHWQQGMVERQGQWFRAIWDKTIAHTVPSEQELDYTMAMVCAAKNNLRRKHGYSPSQWLFGKEPRTGDGALDEDRGLLQREELQTPDQVWERKQRIRLAAREAFLQSQAEASTKRALLGRSRVIPQEYEPGDYVYIFRVDRISGKARHRQNVGEWIGPGMVIGKEGTSYWVSRGGRCLLCAGEHLRPAESEELGGAFQSKVMQHDLLQLVQNIDEDIEETFADARDPSASTKRKYEDDDLMPERRIMAKGRVKMVRKKGASASVPAHHDGGGHVAAGSGGSEDQVEMEGRDEDEVSHLFSDAGIDGAYDPTTEEEALMANEVYVLERRVPKCLIKQSDKEVRWEQIPEEEKHLYLEAEDKQWKEHLKYDAVRVHLPDDAGLLRKKVPKERIIKARFAYRDKNVSKRREDPTVPCKAKARLCVGGHMDPDLKSGQLSTEAPTAGKTSMFVALSLAAQLGWKLAAGDVEAAFLNGVEAKRGLFFEPPKRGLPGVPEGALIEIIKGVFGLVTSPRLWWEKLAEELLATRVQVGGEHLNFQHHPLDPCLFMLRNEEGVPRGCLLTHVDDLLMAASGPVLEAVQDALSSVFPIGDWESDDFDYTGTNIKQKDGVIELSQRSYVNARLETVEIPHGADSNDLADQITKQDNMSTIGALSWLCSQTRPDLQAGVSLAQRKQKQPTYGDVRETNRLVRMAQAGKDEVLRFQKICEDPRDLVLVAYHDAAWANAQLDPETDDPILVEGAGGQGVYSQLGHILCLTHRDVLDGKETNGTIVGWKSHSCPRVCRSTFASEVMAGLEGWEDGLAFRSTLSAAINADPRALQEDEARKVMPLVSITDCKSVYDNVHRIGSPKTPSEKRLIVDVVALKKMVQAEQDYWGTTLPRGQALRWVPTTSQMADVLTKVIVNIQSWWQSIRILRLPF